MSTLSVRQLVMALLLIASPVLAATTIEITQVPEHGTRGSLTGTVTGVSNFDDYEVAAYIQPEGAGWWTKPYFESPTVPIDASGHFELSVTTGGADRWATLYAVNLIGAGDEPPTAAALCHQPESPLFVATDTHERYGRELAFSGRSWGVKISPIKVGPGPNRFGSDNAWVDAQDRLHLAVTQDGSGDWHSAEVIPTESLGHGRYLFQTSSGVDQFGDSVIFGGFLWDAYGQPGLPAGRCNREVDFEDGVWPVGPEGNTQFVVQPWDTPGNLHRFELPDLSADADLTRVLTWETGRLHFLMLRGHFDFDESGRLDHNPADVVEEWEYLHDPDDGHFVPEPGRERFRFNLWLRDGLPPDAGDARELVIDRFAYSSLQPEWMPGDANQDRTVDLSDFAILGRNFGTTGAGWTDGDFNGDSEVDLTDFALLGQNFGVVYAVDDASAVDAAAVPEPTSLVMLGLVGVAALRRRRR